MKRYLNLLLATVIPLEIFAGTVLSASARQVPIELLNVSSGNTEDVLGEDQFYIARALSDDTNSMRVLTSPITVNSATKEGKGEKPTVAVVASAINAADQARFVTGTEAAICGPEKKGLKLRGHTFNVKKANIIWDEWGRPLYVSGQISHHLSFRPDDQIYYLIEYENGMVKKTDVKINRGGWGPIIGVVFPVINAVILVQTGKGLPITPKDVEQAAQDIAKLVGGNWEHQAQILIGLIGMAATNPNYCQ
jgi:hypothetical protein